MIDRDRFPALVTERLHLREIVDADAEALFAIHGDPATMRWFGHDPLPDLDAARRLVQVFASWRDQLNPGHRWALERRDAPGLIGTCGLFAWNRQWRRCTVGYELAAGQQGRGYMHEALCAVLDWGYAEMEVHRIEAQIHPDNAPSLRLARRLGFVEEGRLREIARWGGRQHDMLQFSLLRHEWMPATAGSGPGG